MTKKQFYTRFTKELKEGMLRIQAIREKQQALTDKMNSGKYSKEYIEKNLKPESTRLFVTLGAEEGEVRREATAMINDYLRQLKDADSLHGKDITDDAKILNCGIKLKKEDLLDMLRHNEGNSTMQQIIIRHAEQNGIRLGVAFVGNKKIIDNVEALADTLRYTIPWAQRNNWERDFERVYGPGSAAHAYFMNTADNDTVGVIPADSEAAERLVPVLVDEKETEETGKTEATAANTLAQPKGLTNEEFVNIFRAVHGS